MCNAIKTSNNAPSLIKRIRNSAGFTLIEMSIVTMIIGLVIAASAQILTQRQEWLRADTTRTAVEDANFAIVAYRNTFGRYPCPSSLTAIAGDADYGIESDCTDASVAPLAGISADGYAIVLGQGTVSYIDRSINPLPPPTVENPRIRIGTIPFKNLNMEERQSYDGYRSRIVYAVTEPLTNAQTFEADDGGVTVLNDQGVQITQPADSAHFIVFSPGENGAGGFTSGGNRLACATTSLESENCNFETDSIFQFAQTGTAANGLTETYDDVVSYASHESMPLWDKNPTGAAQGQPGSNDVAMKSTGNLGIGPTISGTPTENVQIEGVIIARDDPGTATAEGTIQSENICDYSSGTTDCFPSSLIAGVLNIDPITGVNAGGGMACPLGEFMVGIQNSAPICVNDVRVQCPAGLIALGINANGSLNCGAPPAPGCISVAVNLCTSSQTLFAASHGTPQTISVSTAPGNPGGTRNARYRCNNGSWVNESTWGSPCNCTPATGSSNNVSCASWSACGTRFTGTRNTQWQYQCPAGSWTNVTLSSACVCDPTSRSRTRGCPSGFNSGVINQTNTHNCAAAPPACSGWIETSRTCACTPNSGNRQVPCTGGLTGNVNERRDFTCPGGSANPGSWGPWTYVSDTCSCTPSSVVEDRACPTAGHIGTYQVQVDFQCPSATTVQTVVTDTCAPPPPVTCKWIKSLGTNYTSSASKIGKPVGSTCNSNCGDPGTCWEGSYRFGACVCQ